MELVQIPHDLSVRLHADLEIFSAGLKFGFAEQVTGFDGGTAGGGCVTGKVPIAESEARRVEFGHLVADHVAERYAVELLALELEVVRGWCSDVHLGVVEEHLCVVEEGEGQRVLGRGSQGRVDCQQRLQQIQSFRGQGRKHTSERLAGVAASRVQECGVRRADGEAQVLRVPQSHNRENLLNLVDITLTWKQGSATCHLRKNAAR